MRIKVHECVYLSIHQFPDSLPPALLQLLDPRSEVVLDCQSADKTSVLLRGVKPSENS